MRYKSRLGLGAFEFLFFLFLISAEPWRIQHADPQNYWAAFHAWLYMALALSVVACPLPKLLAVLCMVGAFALPITRSWAVLDWQSGNDGGAFCWLLVVGPVALLVSVGNILLGIALFWPTRKVQVPGAGTAADPESGHEITHPDHRRQG